MRFIRGIDIRPSRVRRELRGLANGNLAGRPVLLFWARTALPLCRFRDCLGDQGQEETGKNPYIRFLENRVVIPWHLTDIDTTGRHSPPPEGRIVGGAFLRPEEGDPAWIEARHVVDPLIRRNWIGASEGVRVPTSRVGRRDLEVRLAD